MSGRASQACLVALVVQFAACDRQVLIGAEARPEAPDAVARDAEPASVPDAAPPDSAPGPWFATHEGGNLDEWRARGPDTEGGAYGPGIIAITTERAHGGRYAVQITVSGFDGRNTRYGKLFREGPVPARARFSAWFFIPSELEALDYLNLVHFANPVLMLWDVSLHTRSGRPELFLWNHVLQKGYPQPSPLRPVPIGRWFEIAVTLERSESGSRLELYQDGERLIEVPEAGIQASEIIHFNVGTAANNVKPSPLVVYVDDVAIVPL